MKQRSAFTLIEIIIDVAVVALVATAVLGLIITNIRSAVYAQMKVVATNVANQRLEEIRNLPYDQIATQHGAILPQGTLIDQEESTFSGFRLVVQTITQYEDDPYDGLSPADTAPNDYKKVTIKVNQKDKTVALSTLTTNISSKSIETAGNTGVLSIDVVDGANLPVENATVTVTNAQVNPSINITAYTNGSGHVMVPLLTPGQGYKVSVTKAGFSTDTTIAASDCQSLPASPEATGEPTILVQQATSITMQIRCLVDLEISLQNTGDIGAGWLVSGAGDASYNGTYTTSGTYNGQPMYTNGSRWLFWLSAASVWWLGEHPSEFPPMDAGVYTGLGGEVNLPANPWMTQNGGTVPPTLTVSSGNNDPFAGIWVRVRSTRRTCTDPYKTKFDQWKQTDSNGKINFSQIENDKYKYENE